MSPIPTAATLILAPMATRSRHHAHFCGHGGCDSSIVPLAMLLNGYCDKMLSDHEKPTPAGGRHMREDNIPDYFSVTPTQPDLVVLEGPL